MNLILQNGLILKKGEAHETLGRIFKGPFRNLYNRG